LKNHPERLMAIMTETTEAERQAEAEAMAAAAAAAAAQDAVAGGDDATAMDAWAQWAGDGNSNQDDGAGNADPNVSNNEWLGGQDDGGGDGNGGGEGNGSEGEGGARSPFPKFDEWLRSLGTNGIPDDAFTAYQEAKLAYERPDQAGRGAAARPAIDGRGDDGAAQQPSAPGQGQAQRASGNDEPAMQYSNGGDADGADSPAQAYIKWLLANSREPSKEAYNEWHREYTATHPQAESKRFSGTASG